MELFDWKKFAMGFFDPTRILKDAGTLIRMIVILAICFFVWLGIKEIRVMFQPKPVHPTIETVSGGQVNTDASVNAKKVQKFGLLNLW